MPPHAASNSQRYSPARSPKAAASAPLAIALFLAPAWLLTACSEQPAPYTDASDSTTSSPASDASPTTAPAPESRDNDSRSTDRSPRSSTDASDHAAPPAGTNASRSGSSATPPNGTLTTPSPTPPTSPPPNAPASPDVASNTPPRHVPRPHADTDASHPIHGHVRIPGIDADDLPQPSPETMNALAQRLAGTWIQTAGPNAADFAPGGYALSTLHFHPDGRVAVTRSFGSDSDITVQVQFIATWLPAGRFSLHIQQDQSQTRFAPNPVRLTDAAGRGFEILPPAVTLPRTFTPMFYTRSMVIEDKIYQRPGE